MKTLLTFLGGMIVGTTVLVTAGTIIEKLEEDDKKEIQTIDISRQ